MFFKLSYHIYPSFQKYIDVMFSLQQLNSLESLTYDKTCKTNKVQ